MICPVAASVPSATSIFTNVPDPGESTAAIAWVGLISAIFSPFTTASPSIFNHRTTLADPEFGPKLGHSTSNCFLANMSTTPSTRTCPKEEPGIAAPPAGTPILVNIPFAGAVTGMEGSFSSTCANGSSFFTSCPSAFSHFTILAPFSPGKNSGSGKPFAKSPRKTPISSYRSGILVIPLVSTIPHFP